MVAREASTFQQKVDRFREGAPERAARRAAQPPLRRFAGWLAGLAVLTLLALAALAVCALLVAFVVFTAIHEWRILFAMLVVAVAGLAVAKIREG